MVASPIADHVQPALPGRHQPREHQRRASPSASSSAANRSTARVQAALAHTATADVDLVVLDEAPPLLRFEIARDGLVLVERSAYAWADFRRCAMLDWWDWAPTARLTHRAAGHRLRERVRLGSG